MMHLQQAISTDYPLPKGTEIMDDKQVSNRHLHYMDNGQPIILSGNKKSNQKPTKPDYLTKYLEPYHKAILWEIKHSRN